MIKSGQVILYFLFATLVFMLPPAAASAEWIVETVDDTKNFRALSGRAIAIDRGGNPHIAYEGTHLYHAFYDGNRWRNETIDSSNVRGSCSSIVIDSFDNVHMIYCNNEGLYYVTNASGSWVHQIVDMVGEVDTSYINAFMDSASIALDSLNNVHVSYRDHTVFHQDIDAGSLKYATNSSGAWIQNYVVSIGFHFSEYVGGTSSIAVDSADTVHIGYFDENNRALMYATNRSGSWLSETVDGSDKVAQYASLAIDSADSAHISYYDQNNEDLKYAKNRPGGWTVETIRRKGDTGRFSSLSIDTSDELHISYYDQRNEDLNCIIKIADTWEVDTVESNDAINWNGGTSIDVDSSGGEHIAYLDQDKMQVKYATNAVSPADSDGDGVSDNGDGSNVSGDNSCTGGNTEDCDDNCRGTSNTDQADMDNDGVGDLCDNCREVYNPDQHDNNAGEDDNTSIEGEQHYGNACDADYNNNGHVGLEDFNELRTNFGKDVGDFPELSDIDCDGGGFIGLEDFNCLRTYFGEVPGPGIGD